MIDRLGWCPSCGVIYQWDALGWSLEFAYCPECGGSLNDLPPTRLMPVIVQAPIGPIMAAVLREKRRPRRYTR